MPNTRVKCKAKGPYHGDECKGGRIQSPNTQFTRDCLVCKGTGFVEGEVVPDTSKMTPAEYASYTGNMSYPAGHAEQVQERARELQNCPFCGCNANREVVDGYHLVMCYGCYLTSPSNKKSQDTADEAWNRITLKEPV